MKRSRKYNVEIEIESTGIFIKVGSSMKHRIRKLVRSGWTLVELPCLPDECKNDPILGSFPIDPNPAHYKKLIAWCAENVPVNEWTSSFIKEGYTYRTDNRKRFVFKDAKYASWFSLMHKA